jgi:rubrerythrin
MDLSEAIRTALEFEGRVHKTYQDAMAAAVSDAGKRVFKTLCDEEMGHIKYLRERLDEWENTGKITVAKLGTAIPSKASINEGVQKLQEKIGSEVSTKHDAELQFLQKALEVEIETSNFYREMVRTLDSDGQKMFERFVEIEEGHQAIVQAELDMVSGTGFWFDTMEFNLEAE